MESPFANYTTRFEQVAARFALVGCQLVLRGAVGHEGTVVYILPDGTESHRYHTELNAMRCALRELGVSF